MPVSRYYQEKLGRGLAEKGTGAPSTGVPIGGATEFPTRTNLPENDRGIKAFGNLSALLGGGQYNIGSDGNKVIKDERGLSEFSQRQAIRGPYLSKNVGIDHIVPLSLGGTNDETNLQILPKAEFDKKTVVDNLAAFLYQKGKITLGQARNLNKNWNNNPSALLNIKELEKDSSLDAPITFSDGDVFNIKEALKQIQSKEYSKNISGESTKTSFKDVLKGIVPGIEKTLEKGLNVAEAVIGSVPYGLGMSATGQQGFSEATKEYFKKTLKGQEGVFSEPVFKAGLRGFVKGATAGYVNNDEPIDYADPTEETIGKFTGALSEAYGFVKNIKGLAGLFKKAGVAGTGIQALDAGLARIRVPQIVNRVSSTTLNKALNTSPLLKNAVMSSGLFGVHGQISKQEVEGLEARAKRLVHDLGNGALYALTGGLLETKFPSVKAGALSPVNITLGTLGNAYTGYVVSRMEGASEEDALLNGAIFGILHGTGVYERRGLTMDQIKKVAQNQGPLAGMNAYYENMGTLRGQAILQKQAMDYFKRFGITGKVRTNAEINNAVNEVRETLAREVAKGTMSHAQAAPLFQQAVLVSRFLFLQNIPASQRIKQQLKDFASVFTAAKPTKIDTLALKGSVVDDTEAKDFIRRVDETAPQTTQAPVAPEVGQSRPLPVSQVTPRAEAPSILENQFMLTGTRRGASGEERSLANTNLNTIIDKVTAEPETRVRVVLERQPNHPQDSNAIKVTAFVGDEPGLHVGYVPSERMVDRQNRGRGNRGDAAFDLGTNKDTLAKIMDNLGVEQVEANLSPTKLTSSGIDRGQVSGEPYMVLSVGRENLARALQARQTAQTPATSEVSSKTPQLPVSNNRQEFFEAVPENTTKILANGVYEKIEDSIRFGDVNGLGAYVNSYGNIITPEIQRQLNTNLERVSYGDILRLFRSAERTQNLNGSGVLILQTLEGNARDFVQTHGQEAWVRLLQMPISQAPAPTTRLEATREDLPAIPEQEAVPGGENNQFFKQDPSSPAAIASETPITTEGKQRLIFINQALAEGPRTVVGGDYNSFGDNGRLAGISKRVVNRIVELINEGAELTDGNITQLADFYNGLTREKVQRAAKDTGDFQDFVKRYVKKAQDLGFEPFDSIKGRPISDRPYYDQFDNGQLQELKRRYLQLRQTPENSRMVEIVPNGDGLVARVMEKRPDEPTSWIQEKVEKFDNKNVQLLRINNKGDKFANGVKLKGSAADQVQQIADMMRKKSIFFLTDQNGVPSNAQGVYIAPETQKEFIAKYNENPGKYAISDPSMLEALKQAVPGSTIDNDTKVMQVFFNDVLGFGNNFDAPSLFKRINLFDHRDIKWDEPGQMRVLFLPGTELERLLNYDFLPAQVNRESPEFAQLKQKFQEDGARFFMPEDNAALRFYMGAQGHSYNAKGTIVTPLPEGGVLAEKGNTGTLSFPLRNYLERKYGIRIEPGTIVSFTPNIKTGETQLRSLPENPEIKYWDVPKRDMRFIFESPHYEQHGTASLSTTGKFSVNDTVEVNGVQQPIKQDLVNMFAPAANKWVTAWNQVFKEGKNPVEVFSESFGRNMEETGFGKLRGMAKNKADVISLNRRFQTDMLKVFQDTVMRNRSMKGAYLKMLPDMGFYDPATNQWRLLKDNEIMLSREMASDLGNPEFVLTSRFPITKKLALSKMKVLVAEDFGINTLGKDNVINNLFDTYVRKEGDFDGDGLTLHKIISKEQADRLIADGKELDGIPETIADHIEQARQKYITEFGEERNPIGIESAKYPKLPASSAEGRLYIAKRASDAKEQLGGISNASNLANLLVDNARSPLTRGLLTVDGTFYEPQANFQTADKIGQILQAAVDATGKDAFGKLSPIEKNPFSIIFNTQDEKVLSKIFRNLLNTYQKGFRVGNTQYKDGKELMADVNAFLEVIPQDPALRHPWQEVFAPFADVFLPEITTKQIWDSDIAAGNKVKEALEKPALTPRAKEFIKFVEDWQLKKSNAAAAWRANRSNTKLQEAFDTLRDTANVTDYYYENLGKYSPEDLKAISWFLVTDKASNQWYDPKFYNKNLQDGYYVERWDDLFLPEHAQAYYAARQAWYDDNVLKKGPQASNLPPTEPTVPTPRPITPSEPSQLSKLQGLQNQLKNLQ